MKRTREKYLEERLRETIQERGGLAIKTASAYFTGLPDRLILLPGGRVYWVELKSTGKKQTARQRLVSRQLANLGFDVRVMDSVADLFDFLMMVEQEQKGRCT